MARKRFFQVAKAAFAPAALRRSVVAAMRRVVVANSKRLAKENADHLFITGSDTEGRRLPNYAQRTIAIKRRKGQPTNRMTLKDTGDFHNSIRVTAGSEGFAYSATDDKTNELQFRYGDDILGLDKATYKDVLKPLLVNGIIAGLRGGVKVK